MKYSLKFFDDRDLSLFMDLCSNVNLSLVLTTEGGVSLLYNTKITNFITLSGSNNKFYLRNRSLHPNLLQIGNVVGSLQAGYSTKLILVGLGFKIIRSRSAHELHFELHYSHLIRYKIPYDISVKCGKKKLLVFGFSKQRVMDTANEIKKLRTPNAYKAKGIRFASEIIKLKPGKQR